MITTERPRTLHASLGVTPDGHPVIVNADRNILISGRTGTGRTTALDVLAAQYRTNPALTVLSVEFAPRRGGWLYREGDGPEQARSFTQIVAFLKALADACERGAVARGTLVLLEEPPVTNHVVVEAVTTILAKGPSAGVSVVLTGYPLETLMAPVRARCGTIVHLDPLGDHTVAARDAVAAADRLGLPAPTGPGSFVATVGRDECLVGRVAREVTA